jgi:ATP-dependent Clp protease protease subunit
MSRLDEEEDDDKKQIDLPEPQSSQVQKALFKSRTVLIFGEVDMKMAERVSAQLLALPQRVTATSASS